MWEYTEKVMEHFRNPRNVGEIEDPDGVGEVGSLACGDALKLMFKLDETGRINDVKFKTFGCASAIASSSVLTELIKGKTIEEAERITNRDIAEYLGGLPDQKMHCSVMGREALEAAIRNYRTGKTGKESIRGNVVCKCFGVTDTEIERVIRENGLLTVEEVTNFTKAGGGCGQCKPDIQAILDRVSAETGSASGTVRWDGMTNVRKVHLVEDAVARNIRPRLKQDGGDIELIDVEGDVVTIAFRGRCARCPASGHTVKQVVESELRRAVSPDIKVKEIVS